MEQKQLQQQVERIGRSLRQQILANNDDDTIKESDLERINDLLTALNQQTPHMTVALLQKSRIGNTLTKCVTTLKRRRHHDNDKGVNSQLDLVIKSGEALLSQWKRIADQEAKKPSPTTTIKKQQENPSQGLPKTVQAYHARLTQQRKELYKNPPVLPPHHIVIEPNYCPLPQRNKKTGELTFSCGTNQDIQKLLRDFHPNRTPEEILRAGAFGGTYFRSIVSAVTNTKYHGVTALHDTVDTQWITGLDVGTMLTSATYRASINKYRVACGGSLGMWESSGWIADCDPYGWFQWYCRFYRGRRCSDDVRQIQRWSKCAGLKGRFRSQLCNKILASAAKRPEDVSISPVIRQTLLHWGLEITDHVLAKHKQRVGGGA